MRVLGMISGTSHDGIDVAVVDFRLEDGVLRGVIEHTGSTPYAPALRERLVRMLPPARFDMADVCALDTLIGQAFAEAAAAAVGDAGGADLVCSHGQTVFHWVDGGQVLGTLQLGQPAWIAERTGLPVVADVRTRDVAAGGQGAPLVAMMDALLLAGRPGRPAALNLGGIANLTVPLPAGALAFDTGPANALIDAAAVRATGGRLAYDEGGRLAAAGRVDETLLARLLAEPYFDLAPPKTTGKELFNAAYLDQALAAGPEPAHEDVVATVTALTARTVAAQVHRHGVDEVIAAGGGCANPALMALLRQELRGVRLSTSDALGVPADAKEAIAFAMLGWQTAHGLPTNVPSATGAAGGRILGAIVPGTGPLRLPEPLPEPLRTPPTALRLEQPVRRPAETGESEGGSPAAYPRV
ncbi:anhydro-N-acetylmuramic acid kinase [Hamadaea tsunoensis]|uniref:anhydro-N-acetylmuramic acid kinase n=1 Tax=Hamadaea tsunoensis TaxID=53368 RepID=UPI00042A80E1|nr:anhydro-N-acetylmuramic acid kinase [Hamadaea tsunoensis]